MINIIKKGKDIEVQEFYIYFGCTCGCEFEVSDKNDFNKILNLGKERCWKSFKELYYYRFEINCPNCNRKLEKTMFEDECLKNTKYKALETGIYRIDFKREKV